MEMVEDEPELTCSRCRTEVFTDEGCEPTDLCHHCAQAEVIDLRTALAAAIERATVAERERDEARGKAAYMVEAFWLAIADLPHAAWCDGPDDGCECWRSAAAKVASTDDALALCTRVRDLEDELEARESGWQTAHANKHRAARWKALAKRLRVEAAEAGSREWVRSWGAIKDARARADAADARVHFLTEALREIALNPCLDPEGNAAIARAALSSGGEGDGNG